MPGVGPNGGRINGDDRVGRITPVHAVVAINPRPGDAWPLGDFHRVIRRRETPLVERFDSSLGHQFFISILNRPQVAEGRCGYGGSNKAVSVECDFRPGKNSCWNGCRCSSEVSDPGLPRSHRGHRRTFIERGAGVGLLGLT